ncbi:hypothetical protein SAMN05216456_2051 [Devosia crocina]|uniref:Porin n=1 Tax=Devosia crocina TaxID=429728 RepID=A0A1I7NK52_9HYPH|nr:hypothetical protein [Devosia crocina]SFV35027.1 hypothetical protein SAMN05216456_2051 [Devosia crocina]
MKLKSLILGSVAAAGLSTAGYAADLGVLTSLDVCDALGLSGLTISSDNNCLQITGGVSYEFIWGDWNREATVAGTFDEVTGGNLANGRKIPAGNSVVDPVTGEVYEHDWESKVEAWLKAVGTADSDFGPAKAVIKLKSVERLQTWNEGRSNRQGTTFNAVPATTVNGDTTAGFVIDEAYVSVGDTTVIMAGKKGSIANLDDDAPFNFLGLFISDDIDGKGVGIDADTDYLGGYSIQVVSDLGNGVNVGVGLENLGGAFDLNNTVAAATTVAPSQQGTLVGVVSYAGQGITAHVTGAAFGVLDGTVESWAVHAGATGSFDMFKVRGAVSYWDNHKFRGVDVLNALATAEASFDLFKIAISGEVANVSGAGVDYTDYGFGGSIGANITEGVSINLGARYFFDDTSIFGDDLSTWQVAAQVVAAVTETIKVTGEIGGYFGDGISARNYPATSYGFTEDSVFYGAAELAWAPGGGFTSSIKGEINSEEAYKVTFKAAKSFE